MACWTAAILLLAPGVFVPRRSPNRAPHVPSVVGRRSVSLGVASAATVSLVPGGHARAVGAADVGALGVVAGGEEDLVWLPLEPSLPLVEGEPQRDQFPLRFTTYLARFLLIFDRRSRAWWDRGAQQVPLKMSVDRVRALRLEQYGEFTRSVEFGLAKEFKGPGGTADLVRLLRKKFSSTLCQRRQLALLLTFLPDQSQPVDDIAELLGEADNATVRAVRVVDGGAGYDDANPPVVEVTPPAAGAAGAMPSFSARVRNGAVVAVEVAAGGSGFSYAQALEARVEAPPAMLRVRGRARARTATEDGNAAAGRDEGEGAGSRDEGEGALGGDAQAGANTEVLPLVHPRPARVVVEIYSRDATRDVPPPTAWLPETSASVELTTLLPDRTPIVLDARSRVFRIRPAVPPGAPPQADVPGTLPGANATLQRRTLVTGGAPRSGGVVRAPAPSRRAFAAFDPLFGPIGRSPVEKEEALVPSQFARLAFSGAVCAALGHALVTPLDVVKTRLQVEPERFEGLNFLQAVAAIARGQAQVPEGGTTGESGEASSSAGEDDVDPSSDLCAGGADAAGGGNVGHATSQRELSGGAGDVSRKEQTRANPSAPPQAGFPGAVSAAGMDGGGGGSGVGELLRGIDASATGHFVSGGLSFGVTELSRRLIANSLGPGTALLYPRWPTVVGASVVGVVFGSAGIAPFEAARVGMVSKGAAFAPNVVAGIAKLAREQGVQAFYGDKFRVLLLKDVPFAMVKFVTYDAVSALIYSALPSLSESLRSSLLVSLASGFVAGVAAAVFSHPADTIFTQLNVRSGGAQGAESEASGHAQGGALAAARALVGDSGVSALFTGVGTRAVLSGLLLSIEFLVYDYLRKALHVGAEDLELYLDVLGGLRQ